MHPRPFPLLAVSLLTLATLSFDTARADWCTPGTNAAYFDMGLEYPQGGYFPAPCGIVIDGVSARIYVRAISIPFQKARFTVPDAAGVTVVNESWGVSFTGDHASGVEVDMGSCVGPFDRLSSVTIGYMDVVWANPAECAPWNVVNAEIQACDGGWRPVYEVEHKVGIDPCYYCLWQLCYWPLAPYDLEPANGATVPANVVLKWKYTHVVDRPVSYVRITTQPDCTFQDGTYSLQYATEFAPDFLEPGQTYYWQPRFGDCCDGGCQDGGGLAWGPIYSFTVEGEVRVESTTWGRVKALYRD